MQGGAPQLQIDYKPINYRYITNKNHSYWSYLHQLSYRLGAPPCRYSCFICIMCFAINWKYPNPAKDDAVVKDLPWCLHLLPFQMVMFRFYVNDQRAKRGLEIVSINTPIISNLLPAESVFLDQQWSELHSHSPNLQEAMEPFAARVALLAVQLWPGTSTS